MWPKQVFGGLTCAGYPVGILTISTRHPLLPANVQHAQSFLEPVIYGEVPISDPQLLMRGEASLLGPILVAAHLLVRKGVGCNPARRERLTGQNAVSALHSLRPHGSLSS